MRVTITRGDDLYRETWVFVLRVYGTAALEVYEYTAEERRTKRHVWRRSAHWVSWDASRNHRGVPTPTVPPDVEAEMREAMAVALAALPLVVG